MDKTAPKIALLPLYLQLYDDTVPELRGQMETFLHSMAQRLTDAGIEVITLPVCKVASQFQSAVAQAEAAQVEALVTLHLAYSPSDEAQRALCETKLPIIVMDTTPQLNFGPQTSPDAIMQNHGIHGVQDLCSVLRRHNKAVTVCAGHCDDKALMEKIETALRVARMTRRMQNARIGMVGGPFKGMGDFFVPETVLKEQLNLTTVHYDLTLAEQAMHRVTQAQIQEEYRLDRERFLVDAALPWEVYERSARVGLALRRWMEEQCLTGVSVNYLVTEGSPAGFPVMPFSECSQAMARGIGYAGEGDILTAALTGALLAGYDASFSEMFCPDWAGESVFMSHMGECNPAVAAGRPRLMEKVFPFTSAENPTMLCCTMRPGRAVFADVAPRGDGRYGFTLVRGQMLAVAGENKLAGAISGWFKPDIPLAEMLERYSMAGGTHHGVIVYTADCEPLKAFARNMGFQLVVL